MFTIYSDDFNFNKLNKKEVIKYKKNLCNEIKNGLKIEKKYYINKLKIVNNYIFNNFIKGGGLKQCQK